MLTVTDAPLATLARNLRAAGQGRAAKCMEIAECKYLYEPLALAALANSIMAQKRAGPYSGLLILGLGTGILLLN